MLDISNKAGSDAEECDVPNKPTKQCAMAREKDVPNKATKRCVTARENADRQTKLIQRILAQLPLVDAEMLADIEPDAAEASRAKNPVFLVENDHLLLEPEK
ncbi:hypothetical protein AAL_05975 [Moelleriella libera RCEF 2490]|uniref:Uncharacterized protein n=1 Tax=Moelleriella libera RCEF 2490 TaxID=1081109 RepID=A0A162IG55_9HYPO|nr:hypothetical protein AAL_05975 [Moelleriella libera RCEF 2490]